MMTQDILTPRLRIRSTREADGPLCLSLWLDEEVGRYLADPPRDKADEAELHFADGIEQDDGWYPFVAFARTAADTAAADTAVGAAANAAAGAAVGAAAVDTAANPAANAAVGIAANPAGDAAAAANAAAANPAGGTAAANGTAANPAENPAAGEFIGTCSLVPQADGITWDLGYCVAQAHWRQGYGTEMITAMLNFARSRGGRVFTAAVAQQNAGSNAVLRKLGFTVAAEGSFAKRGTDIVYPEYIYRLEDPV